MMYTTMRALGKAIAEDGVKYGVFADYETREAVVNACWSFASVMSDRKDDDDPWMTPTLAEQVGTDKPVHPDFRLGVLDVEIPGVRE